jgi:hypothetical protein
LLQDIWIEDRILQASRQKRRVIPSLNTGMKAIVEKMAHYSHNERKMK